LNGRVSAKNTKGFNTGARINDHVWSNTMPRNDIAIEKTKNQAVNWEYLGIIPCSFTSKNIIANTPASNAVIKSKMKEV